MPDISGMINIESPQEKLKVVRSNMIQKNIKKIITSTLLLLMTLLFILGCTGQEQEDTIGSLIESGDMIQADLTDHEGFTVENHMFYETDFETLLYLMENTSERFLLYVGFGECPWCVHAIPVMYEAARENNIDRILYVDRRSEVNFNPDNPMELQEPEIALIEFLENHMEIIEREMADGSTLSRIFVPELIYWNGETVAMRHHSTTECHIMEIMEIDCWENEGETIEMMFLPEMTEEQHQELFDSYMEIMEQYAIEN